LPGRPHKAVPSGSSPAPATILFLRKGVFIMADEEINLEQLLIEKGVSLNADQEDIIEVLNDVVNQLEDRIAELE
jgi:hypothetical protein